MAFVLATVSSVWFGVVCGSTARRGYNCRGESITKCGVVRGKAETMGASGEICGI